jgi:hypothetical protein
MATDDVTHDGYVAIASVHRDDIARVLVDELGWRERAAAAFARKLSDAALREVAEELGEAYMVVFWDDLCAILQQRYRVRHARKRRQA